MTCVSQRNAGIFYFVEYENQTRRAIIFFSGVAGKSFENIENLSLFLFLSTPIVFVTENIIKIKVVSSFVQILYYIIYIHVALSITYS